MAHWGQKPQTCSTLIRVPLTFENGTVTLEKVMNFFVNNVIFRYSLTSTIFFLCFK